MEISSIKPTLSILKDLESTYGNISERYVTREEFENSKSEPFTLSNDSSVPLNNNHKQPFLDKDKLILVYYVNVEAMTTHKAMEYLANIKIMLDKTFDYSVIPLVVPIRGEQHSYIETLNNETLSKEQFEQIKNIEKFLKDNLKKNGI